MKIWEWNEKEHRYDPAPDLKPSEIVAPVVLPNGELHFPVIIADDPETFKQQVINEIIENLKAR